MKPGDIKPGKTYVSRSKNSARRVLMVGTDEHNNSVVLVAQCRRFGKVYHADTSPIVILLETFARWAMAEAT